MAIASPFRLPGSAAFFPVLAGDFPDALDTQLFEASLVAALAQPAGELPDLILSHVPNITQTV